jgi:hypothetical protein
MDKLLQFFQYEHLKPHLQTISKPFSDLAHEIAATLPLNAESTTAMRKLMEAKDCAVRAMLFKADWKPKSAADKRG